MCTQYTDIVQQGTTVPCFSEITAILCSFLSTLQPVLGPLDPGDLGVTLTHEHLLMDYTKSLKSPEYGPDNLADLEMKMENLGKIRHFP